MKVVPKRASRIVTRSDSAYSAKELRLATTFTGVDAGVDSIAGPGSVVSTSTKLLRRFRRPIRNVPTPFLRRPVPLLFCCVLPHRTIFFRRATLPLRTSFDGRGRTHCVHDIPPEAGRAAAAIPAKRIYRRRVPDRTTGCPALVPARCAEGTKPPREVRHREKWHRG